MKAKTTTPADENVATVVRMLLAAKRATPDDVAKALGISRSTVFDKLNGNRRWYADEVQGLAQFFHLPIATFYDGFAALANSQGYWPTSNAMATDDSYQESLLDALASTAA